MKNKFEIIFLIWIVYLFMSLMLMTCKSTRSVMIEVTCDSIWSTDSITEVESPVEVIKLDSMYVTAVKYNAVESQTDSSPLITADNSIIDLDSLNSYKLRWVAISRDLESKLSMGDTITIYSDNIKLNGDWVIHDRMNSRYYNKIDLLVPLNDTLDFNYPTPMLIKFKSKNNE